MHDVSYSFGRFGRLRWECTGIDVVDKAGATGHVEQEQGLGQLTHAWKLPCGAGETPEGASRDATMPQSLVPPQQRPAPQSPLKVCEA